MFNPRLLRTTADEEETSANQLPQPTLGPDHALPSVQMMAFRPMTAASPTPAGLAQMPMYYNQMQMSQINMMPGVFPMQGMTYGFAGNANPGQPHQQPDVRSPYGFPTIQHQYMSMVPTFAGANNFSAPTLPGAVAEQKPQERQQEPQRNLSNYDSRNSRRDDRPSGNQPTQFAKLGSYQRPQDKTNSYSRDHYSDRKDRDNRGTSSGGHKAKQGFASSNPYADDYPDREQNRDKRESPRRHHTDSDSLLAKRAPVHSSDRQKRQTSN